ncbi:MAG: SurA N-terminal domain-containing protein [Candidatus Harrisonbacteria bacterium]|nr:SurA N-terminal domain-containing protein [Candidatus Harrisonbacteria bacterium]
MRKHHFYAGLVLVVALGAGIFYVLHNGLYPVATVNGAVVTADEFQHTAVAALNFYVKAKERVAARQLTVEERDALFDEIRRATLDKLVEESLIEAELKRRVGDATARAEEKLKAAERADFREAVPQLYGVSYDDFLALVLLPQARREVLNDALAADAVDAQTWLANARETAQARIFLPALVWQNGTVEIAK